MRRFAALALTAVVAFTGVFSGNFASNVAAAQPEWNSYNQKIYNTTNGLMSNHVTCIGQTPNGLVWMGTDKGLAAFDGNEFTDYQDFYHFDSVNDMIVTDTGYAWYSTSQYGPAIYLGSRFHQFDDISELASNYSLCVAMGPDGVIYNGTSRYMVSVSPDEGFVVRELNTNGLVGVKSLTGGKKLVGGVTLSGEVAFLNSGELVALFDESERNVNTIQFADGLFLVGTKDGHVLLFDEDDIEKGCIKDIDTLINDRINSFYIEDGRLWLLYENTIGYYNFASVNDLPGLNPKDFNSCYFDGFETGFTDMMVDYQGNYWFSSSKRGVLLLGATYFYNELAFLSDDRNKANVTSSLIDGNLMYVTNDTGIDVISLENGERVDLTISDDFASSNVTDICNIGNEKAVAVYNDGVYLISKDGKTVTKLGKDELGSDRVIGFKEITWKEKSALCILLRDGFSVFDILSKSVVATFGAGDGLYCPEVTGAVTASLKKCSDTRTYLSSNGGGIYVFEAGRFVETIDENNGIPSKYVNDIALYDGGIFAVSDRGFFFYNGKKVYTFEEKISGIENAILEEIRIDNDTLYLAGDEELYIVDAATLWGDEDEVCIYSKFDTQSGYSAKLSDGAHCYFGNGNFYIPAGSKLNSISKERLAESGNNFKILLNSFKADNREIMIPDDNRVLVTNDTEKIDIYCSVLSFANENPNVRYALVGVDSEFVTVRKNELETISYEGLAGGNYEFVFELLDDQGNATDSIHLTIVKDKSFFENLAVRMICLALGFSVLMFFVFKSKKQNDIDKQK